MSNAGGAGFKYTPTPVSWNSRDVMLFAVSIGVKGDDLHFLFASEEDRNFQVFPTYATTISAKGESSDLIPFTKKEKLGIAEPITGAPLLDIKRMVDGGRGIEFLKSLPTSSKGYKFEMQSQVEGVYDKGKAGTVVASSTNFVDILTGDIYARITSNHFYVGQGNWGGPKGPATVNYPPPQRKADATYDILTTAETSALYRLNGDSNALHLVPDNGIKLGFGGPILHGLFFWNASAYAILRQWARSNPANMRQFEAKFSSPVSPGKTIRVSSWVTGSFDSNGFQEIRFIAEVVGGKTCLSNGRAFIKSPGGKL
ncbi:HotDog domain-containing protein [Phaeosphaeriaceae sp. PMI808]|nr:HotDog domain-containing protein [Phaeosphaeriaceae sp. PMI808]